MAVPPFWYGVPLPPVFWEKRLQTIENKRREGEKESKEKTRGGKLLGTKEFNETAQHRAHKGQHPRGFVWM